MLGDVLLGTDVAEVSVTDLAVVGGVGESGGGVGVVDGVVGTQGEMGDLGGLLAQQPLQHLTHHVTISPYYYCSTFIRGSIQFYIYKWPEIANNS